MCNAYSALGIPYSLPSPVETPLVGLATNFVAKLWQNYLPPALIALAFQNGIRYCYLSVRINSINEGCISCENFMQFSPVTPELTELICECQVQLGQKH